jgi:hypothetical protein
MISKSKIKSDMRLEQSKMPIWLSLLASAYRCPEDVGIKPIIVLELKLSDIQRQIFATNLVGSCP